ncbi:MAG: hypothetical protein A2Z88_01985 [Omnitrophica WOR_2 bacterium GWA2_47_8]|nr:MAG: hypothetical protein A2Z88_01985 [Omnitrophica WOR_2 bacterium GWA2_47_8]
MQHGIYYFTARGLDAYRARIQELEIRLREVQAYSADAADVGGNQYHDNASYENLVIQLRGLDNQVNEGHRILNSAKVIEAPKDISSVTIGCCVKYTMNGVSRSCVVVGFGESDPLRGLLAYDTPIGQLLIGLKVGEIHEGSMQGRQVEIEIVDIFLPSSREEQRV